MRRPEGILQKVISDDTETWRYVTNAYIINVDKNKLISILPPKASLNKEKYNYYPLVE